MSYTFVLHGVELAMRAGPYAARRDRRWMRQSVGWVGLARRLYAGAPSRMTCLGLFDMAIVGPYLACAPDRGVARRGVSCPKSDTG